MHDGVLQVLALVQRRGAELGGDAAELGRLAGEQEVALRTLIRAQDAVAADGRRGTLDLAAALAALGSRPGVQVAAPGDAGRAAAARSAPSWSPRSAPAWTTSRVHVGAGAPAWVLLEAFPDRVEVSVRDEGPGIPEGRLRDGRGRGPAGRRRVDPRPAAPSSAGRAALHTGPDGTEWELSVPRRLERE